MSEAAQLFDLEGQVAIVTGASSGLGRHFALTLARNGAKVAAAARRAEPGTQGRPFSPVPLVSVETDPPLGREPLDDLRGPVARPVVDDHDLVVLARKHGHETGRRGRKGLETHGTRGRGCQALGGLGCGVVRIRLAKPQLLAQVVGQLEDLRVWLKLLSRCAHRFSQP